MTKKPQSLKELLHDYDYREGWQPEGEMARRLRKLDERHRVIDGGLYQCESCLDHDDWPCLERWILDGGSDD